MELGMKLQDELGEDSLFVMADHEQLEGTVLGLR